MLKQNDAAQSHCLTIFWILDISNGQHPQFWWGIRLADWNSGIPASRGPKLGKTTLQYLFFNSLVMFYAQTLIVLNSIVVRFFGFLVVIRHHDGRFRWSLQELFIPTSRSLLWPPGPPKKQGKPQFRDQNFEEIPQKNNGD